MKKALVLFTYLVSFSSFVFSQINEGKIVYKITYSKFNASASQIAMLPNENICYFLNNFTRTESYSLMGGNSVTLCLNDTITFLMDYGGKKIAINPKEDDSDNNIEQPKIKYVNEVKMVSGHSCLKALLDFKDGSKMTVWYAEDIVGGGSWGGKFKGLKGAPLEYTIVNKFMSMTMVAVNVIKEKVPEELLKIPEGYEFITQKQFKKLFK